MLDTRALARRSDFDLSPSERSLLELNSFLQSPRSIGIDSLKESLSNVVRYNLELQGLETGQDNQIINDEQHDSISLDERPNSKKNKRKRMQADADLMMKLEEELAMHFAQVFLHVEKQLDNVSTNIDREINNLDAQIDEMGDDHDENCEKLQSRKERRTRLKEFKKRVKSYRKEITLAAQEMDTARLIELEQNLYQDHQAFNQRGVFPPTKRAPNIFDLFPQHKTKMPIFPNGQIDLGIQTAVHDLVSGADDLVNGLLKMAKLEAKSEPNAEPSSPDAD